jgi:hypothetical protein
MSFSRRLAEIFTSALLGYIWGWIAGWVLFDPDLDLWALFAALGALVGLVAGVAGMFKRWEALLLCATFGLYLGFVARARLFGDTPGGPGAALVLFGAVLGGVWGRRLAMHPASGQRRILYAALYVGFFGGFLLDIVLFDRLLGLVRQHTAASQGALVLICAGLGGLAASKVGQATG